MTVSGVNEFICLKLSDLIVSLFLASLGIVFILFFSCSCLQITKMLKKHVQETVKTLRTDDIFFKEHVVRAPFELDGE